MFILFFRLASSCLTRRFTNSTSSLSMRNSGPFRRLKIFALFKIIYNVICYIILINLCYYTSWPSSLVAGTADDAEMNEKTTTTRMARENLAIIFY